MVFELMLNPRRSERRPWEMFVVTFTVMFSVPFFYFMLKIEEEKDSQIDNSIALLKEHGKALHSLIWLFMGFIVGFSILFIVVGSTDNFRAQIETFCIINSPSNFEGCISQYGVRGTATGFATSFELLGGVFTNNLYVLVFTVIFSILFGAGGIFILAWNATVISSAVVLFAK